MIRNTDRLTGFTQHEIEIIALIARYHRRGRPKERHREFAALVDTDQRRVRILAGLVRIAIGLDRSHAARISSVRVLVDDSATPPQVTIEPLAHDESDDLELELYAAADRSKLLADALGVDIVSNRPATDVAGFEST